MLSKKVFTFLEFVNENYYTSGKIYEEDSWTPSKEDILRVLEIQKKIGESIQFKQTNKQFKLAYDSLDTYNSLSEQLQTKSISEIQEAFKKKNLPQKRFEKFVELLEEKIEKKNGQLSIDYSGVQQPFYITVTKEKLEKIVKKDGTKSEWKDSEFSIIPDGEGSQFFKNNMYEIKEDNLKESFVDEEITKQVLDLLDKKISEAYDYYIEEGKSGIDEIEIETSCSRYRNLGPAVDLSWAELAYKRVGTFAKYIQIKANEISKNDEEFVEQIIEATKLDFLGTNGDGTSGPDPDKNEKGDKVKKGYYIKDGKKSKWMDVTSQDLTQINVVEVEFGDKSMPVIGTKANKVKAKDQNGVEMEKIPSTPKEYDPYKYFQISIKCKSRENESSGSKETLPSQEVIVTDNYSVKILIPRKFKKDLTTFKLRTKIPGKIFKRKKSRKGKPLPCPVFYK